MKQQVLHKYTELCERSHFHFIPQVKTYLESEQEKDSNGADIVKSVFAELNCLDFHTCSDLICYYGLRGDKGYTQLTIKILAARIIRFISKPIRRKSLNLYPPGP